MNAFESLPFRPADILLPKDCEYSKWSVVACDQYTSQPEYWQRVAEYVGRAPSTLRMILPESCLEGPNVETDIMDINTTMSRYLREGRFVCHPDALFYVERTLDNGKVRRGLMGMVDLEQYDYEPGAESMVRATEGTVLSRIPPRVAVRKNAPIELPHVMLLADDPQKTVIEPLTGQTGEMSLLYDFDLMEGGGHLRGWAVEDDARLEQVRQALVKLLSRQTDGAPLLFAVGDGNHSLATAKAHWEAVKATLSPAEAAVHPARYALAEIENIHDDALTFEPIHRFLTGINGYELMQDWTYYCEIHGMDLSEVTQQGDAEQALQVIYGGSQVIAAISKPDGCMAVDTLQRYLDDLMARRPGLTLDYIHGEDTLRALCGDAYDRVGFVLPAMDKEQFFPTLRRVGVLPRKTFSMGEAHEKRYYMECRKIR